MDIGRIRYPFALALLFVHTCKCQEDDRSCPTHSSPCMDIKASFCLNHGLCCSLGSENLDQYFCSCGRGYYGARCQNRMKDPDENFRCSSTGYIDKSLVCDGKSDCKDGSDEFECNKEYFETNFLLVTDEKLRNIFQVSLTSGETRPVHSVKAYYKISPKTIDYDPMKKMIYYIKENSINGSDICLRNMTRPVSQCSTLSYYADTIAVDNKMIGYFSTYIGSSNVMAEFNLKKSKINSFFLSPPGTMKAITLSNERTAGQLYWSQCESGKRKYSIENAQTGKLSEHQSVVSNLRSCATATAVDLSGGVIYWGEESGDLRMADLNGYNKTLIHRDPLASYAGLALDSEYLYISDSNKRYIQKLNRNTSVLTNMTGPVFGKPGNIKIHTSSIGVDLDQIDEATNERRPTVTVKTTNEGELSPFWIAVVVCVFLAVVAAIVTIGVLVAKKMSNVPSTNAEYELTLPTPYVYDGHYDAILDRPDDKQTQENDLPYNEPEYDYITDDKDSKDVEDKPDD